LQHLKERFSQLTSSVPGKWTVAISVPHVFVENHADSSLQIVLTPQGFVVLGGGHDPQGLIVEKGAVRSLSGAEKLFFSAMSEYDSGPELAFTCGS
jgi:hypothetical protein